MFFFQSLAYSFILLIGSFTKQKFLILKFSLLNFAFDVVAKNLLWISKIVSNGLFLEVL